MKRKEQIDPETKEPFSKKTEGILYQFDFRTNSFSFLCLCKQDKIGQQKSTGCPRVTTLNEGRCLAVTAKGNKWSTASDLTRPFSSAPGTTVSRQTMYRRLG
ncbi:hypothetical protein TNCV_4571421 [Trichonephila clavipes]|nr:hypothetical protein TNCV_4571421 [Trichonephila clavipes]